MDDDHRELVRRLFAVATELIELAHDAAVAGQSDQITAARLSRQAFQLLNHRFGQGDKLARLIG